MSYSPNNVDIYTAAFAGVMAGRGIFERDLKNSQSSTYTLLSQVAGAWAQAFDTVWASGNANELDVQLALEFSAGYWDGRAIQSDTSTSVSTYTSAVTVLIAAITAGEAYFAGEGITPPDIGGGATIQVQDEGAGDFTATTLNFTGAGVSASDAGGGVATINIPNAGMTVEDEGAGGFAATTMNFVGGGVTATDAGSGVATVTIPGGGNPLTDETFTWAPTASPDVSTVSKQVQYTATNGVEQSALTIAQADETACDYTATVLARSPSGEHFGLDLRGTWQRTGGSVSELRSPSSSSPLPVNPGAWDARLALSGTDVKVLTTSEADVQWSVVCNVQINSLTVTFSFNPTSLALTGLWQPDFSGSPWVGVASAGISAAQNLSEATNPPIPGAALNGFIPASFDGVNDILNADDTGNTYFNSNSGSFAVLYKHVAADLPAPFGPAAANALGDPSFFADVGAYGTMAINSTGPKPAITDDGATYKAIQLTATDGWRLFQVKWDGSTMKARLDGNVWSSVATGGWQNLATAILVGTNHASTIFAKTNIIEMFTSDQVLSDSDFDDLVTYINLKYGLLL